MIESASRKSAATQVAADTSLTASRAHAKREDRHTCYLDHSWVAGSTCSRSPGKRAHTAERVNRKTCYTCYPGPRP
jgi:hypothetical protein